MPPIVHRSSPSLRRSPARCLRCSHCIIYIGVLVDTAHNVIRPTLEGVPEFTAGLAIWHDSKEPSRDIALGNVIVALEANQAGSLCPWTRRQDRDGDSRTTLISTSQSFSK